MTTVLTEQCAKSAEEPPSGISPVCLLVSTSLTTWTTANPEQFARDFQINDTVYRKLDPAYYAWLRSRMAGAKKAATAGHLPLAAFEDLRVRFNAVHEWAIKHFGEAPLLAAVRGVGSDGYDPPVAEDERPRVPSSGVRRSGADVILPEATALVDAISEPALALGWGRDRLYGVGPQRGLICFLKGGDRIGEVTQESIEIILSPPSDVRHRFYNPDVDQPWIKKIDGTTNKVENPWCPPGISR